MIRAELSDVGFYRGYLVGKGLRESTIEIYLDSVELFLSLSPDIENLDHYNNFLKKYVYDKRSYYMHYAIKHYIGFKIKDIALRNVMYENLLRPKNDDPIKNSIYLSNKKRQQIVENMRTEKNRLIAKIQFHTGARVGDVLKLKRGSINFENHKGKIAMKIIFVGKRGSVIPKYIFDEGLQKEILDFIKVCYLDDYYYFVDFSKARKATREIEIIRSNYIEYWRELKESCRRCGVNPKLWASHDFRRSISRDIWEDKEMGKDLQLLQNFLGHKNPSTTLRYLKNSGLNTIDVSKRLNEQRG